MTKLNYKKILCCLFCLTILFCQVQTTFAKDRHKDLFTVINNNDKFRYYSSPEDSAYIKTLPEGYVHVYTKSAQPIETEGEQIGDEYRFVTNEPINLSDFLTLPQGSVISGKVIKDYKVRYLIRNARIKVNFDKIITPNGYTFNLSEDTFEVMPLIIMKGSRYAFVNEILYSSMIGGAKYPIGRFLNVPVSYAISSGAGLIGGIAYGAFLSEIPKQMGLGILRGLGGKSIINIFFLSGKEITVPDSTEFMLTIKNKNIEKMKYLPQYLNLQQLLLASSMSDDPTIDAKLISKSSENNTNAAQVISYYENSVISNPDNITEKVNLGKSYISSSQYQKAIQLFKDITNNNQKDPAGYYYLAQALEEAGNLSDAMINYDKAIQLNLNDKNVYLKMANLLNKMGKSTEAAKYFDMYNNVSLAVN